MFKRIPYCVLRNTEYAIRFYRGSMSKSKSFYLLSLGCSKNTVDSESMAQLLGGAGFKGTDDPNKASVLIVNTCGFIGPAKEESVNALRELAKTKKMGKC